MAETNAKKQGKLAGSFSEIGKFFKGVKSEVKKITWPKRKQVINNTLIVIAVVVIIGIIIAIFDSIFQLGIFKFLLKRG